MYIGLIHNDLKNRIFVLVMVTGCIVRVVTNYLYGMYYESPNVDYRIRKLKKVLGAKSRAEIVLLAYLHNLIEYEKPNIS